MANLVSSPLLEAMAAPALRDAGEVLLVGPTMAWGRELLRAHALRSGGWVGWRATTLRGVAELLAERPLARSGLRAASDVTVGAAIDEAFRLELARGSLGEIFVRLRSSAGFHRALRHAVLELRAAGVEPAALRAASDSIETASLALVIAAYTNLLRARALADHGEVMRVALDSFAGEAHLVLPRAIALAPGWAAHGLRRQLLQRLLAAGARPLVTLPLPGTNPPTQRRDGETASALRTPPADSVEALAAEAGREAWHVAVFPDGTPANALAWLGAPEERSRVATDDASASIQMFHADSPLHEVRDVVRRALAVGASLDEVEIVATDADMYGSALAMLCRQLDIGSTMVNGVPLPVTRIGRALSHWFAWLESFLDASVLRSALESGDLVPADAEVPIGDIVRELREQQIGWGRSRYLAAIARLRGARASTTLDREDPDDEDAAARAERSQRARIALASLLESMLSLLPSSFGDALDEGASSSTVALANATLTFVAGIPVSNDAERRVVEELQEALGELSAQVDAACGHADAIAAVRDVVMSIRAWPCTRGTQRRTASPGQLHLTTLSHAGTSGRSHVFVVGLDADHAIGPTQQGALLPDTLRQCLGESVLPTTSRRREGAAWELATSLGRLRGNVTLSWADAPSLGGRFSAPSPVMLDAWRAVSGNATADYGAMRATIGPPACAIPESAALAADERDVWLAAHTRDGLLLDGTRTVMDAFDGLRHGLYAVRERTGESPGAWHGVVPGAAGVDPRVTGRAVSPSGLEALAACPLRWFYRYVLGLRAPDDLQRDPAAWLDPAARGNLLHDVFAWASGYVAEHGRDDVDAVGAAVSEKLAELIERAERDIPSPGAAVVAAERAELQRDVQLFLDVELLPETPDVLVGCEVEFGEADSPVLLELPDGSRVRLRGRIDRIDRLPDGTLRVVDYKTGGSKRFSMTASPGPLRGGRALQLPLYAVAASQLNAHAIVSAARYAFPTVKGQGESVPVPAQEFARTGVIVESLLAHVDRGEFIPTNDKSDCTYCDFAVICRASRDKYGNPLSPRADWAKEFSEDLPQYDGMKRRRDRDAT